MTRQILILLTVLLAQSIPTVAQSKEKNLDRWMDRELIPYVRQQLLVHPRFKNETVMFVVLRDNAPASSSNALALSLRDRMLAAAVATRGVAIGWQQGRGSMSPDAGPHDCTLDDVHYYIGIELRQRLDSSYSVIVRALDLEDRNWVTGFGKRWQGQLSTSERQAMRQPRIDETFLGARDVPFTLAQTDLLAAYLAHKMSCTLQRRVADEYVVATDLREPPESGLEGTVELVSNNLASRQALRLGSDNMRANAVMSGKAHQIDGVLHQYWLTVTPRSEDDDVTVLSASAYVVLPEKPVVASASPPPSSTKTSRIEKPATATAAPASVSIPNAGKDALIGPLRIASPSAYSDCRDPDITVREATYFTGAKDCSLLQARVQADSIVFFLAHQARHGLVRLAGRSCHERTRPRIARSGESLSFPIAETTTAKQNWSETFDWLLEPELDTYYAVVVTDARLARRVANHIDDLPLRCSNSVRPGLTDAALRAWLGDFAMLAAGDAQYVDWRAVQVRDVL